MIDIYFKNVLFLNIGMFGVRSCAPIILPPQACSLGLGAIIETVIPKAESTPDKGVQTEFNSEQTWQVS
jgi:pyruvate/2-oxoglutarate dehydrogenase complex dihydrolipoamide acyltransferase (E2) component